jgi:hypothetical protein
MIRSVLRYQKIPMSFTYYSRTITTLQSLTSIFHVTKHRDLKYGMIGEKFKCGTCKAALDDVRYL